MAKFIVTGGGTGGHVFPALSITEELQRRGHTVLYVGTEKGLESKLVPEKKVPFYTVKTGAVKNQGALKILNTLGRLFLGLLWSIRFLMKEKPAAVIGVGGYVSFPICFAAFLSRIPVYLQEQNSSVGISNRILGRIASKIFLGFEEAIPYFPAHKCVVTGNPLRSDFAKSLPVFNAESGFLLVMGGSQGAKAINDALVSILPELKKAHPSLKVLHQIGARDYENFKEQMPPNDWYTPVPFIADVVSAYGKASLTICRSGALTVSELIRVQRPVIFVPYPRKGQNDQTTNAYLMEKRGVARVVEQGQDFTQRLRETVLATFKAPVLKGLAKNYDSFKPQDGARAIVDSVENV